jgi:hypothetical protein
MLTLKAGKRFTDDEGKVYEFDGTKMVEVVTPQDVAQFSKEVKAVLASLGVNVETFAAHQVAKAKLSGGIRVLVTEPKDNLLAPENREYLGQTGVLAGKMVTGPRGGKTLVGTLTIGGKVAAVNIAGKNQLAKLATGEGIPVWATFPNTTSARLVGWLVKQD